MVTFSFERYARKDIPANPRILRVRTDVEWGDVVDNSLKEPRYLNGNHSSLYIIIISLFNIPYIYYNNCEFNTNSDCRTKSSWIHSQTNWALDSKDNEGLLRKDRKEDGSGSAVTLYMVYYSKTNNSSHQCMELEVERE